MPCRVSLILMSHKQRLVLMSQVRGVTHLVQAVAVPGLSNELCITQQGVFADELHQGGHGQGSACWASRPICQPACTEHSDMARIWQGQHALQGSGPAFKVPAPSASQPAQDPVQWYGVDMAWTACSPEFRSTNLGACQAACSIRIASLHGTCAQGFGMGSMRFVVVSLQILHPDRKSAGGGCTTLAMVSSGMLRMALPSSAHTCVASSLRGTGLRGAPQGGCSCHDAGQIKPACHPCATLSPTCHI